MENIQKKKQKCLLGNKSFEKCKSSFTHGSAPFLTSKTSKSLSTVQCLKSWKAAMLTLIREIWFNYPVHIYQDKNTKYNEYSWFRT